MSQQDEGAFRKWYAQKARENDLSPNPDDPNQFYDYRAAFRANASPDSTGHWPSDFKKPGHPNMVVGGFNVQTGERVPGTKQAGYDELVSLGWEPETAKKLSATADQGRVVIVDNAGQRHIFPAGFDPRRAAGIVAQQTKAKPEREPGLATIGDHVKSRSLFDRSTAADFPVLGMLKGAWNVAKEIPAGLVATATDLPPGLDSDGSVHYPFERTISGLANAHANVAKGAINSAKRGDYITAARKGMNAAVPLFGPVLDASDDKIMRGDIAEGIGEVVTNVALTALPSAKGAPKGAKAPILSGPANAKDAAAVAFAKQRGIPLDAGTATGSNFIKNVQEKAANTFGGARTAEALQGTQNEHLARVGGELADATGVPPTNPVAAGEGVRTALTKGIEDAHATANTHYTNVRAKTQGVTMDLGGFKQSMKPIYDRLLRESELAPLQGGKAKALVALDRIMGGPDTALLGDVDAALSDLKALARGADMPELRNAGQGITASAVQQLDAQVRTAAAKANALQDLEAGRTATKQKYAIADVRDMLSEEPRQVYRQLTQSKDIGLERLKAVQQHAPKEMPKVARAFLEDAIDQATAEGGFDHADRLWANWQKLGDQSKSVLFSKAQIADLDNFFLGAKRIKEIKNPSGTAKVAGVLDVATALPAWVLAKILMTEGGVKFLTTARAAGRSHSVAAKTLAIAQLTKAAQSAGVPLDAIPALAGDSSTEPQRRSGTKQ